jgi:hypothetical protein
MKAKSYIILFIALYVNQDDYKYDNHAEYIIYVDCKMYS